MYRYLLCAVALATACTDSAAPDRITAPDRAVVVQPDVKLEIVDYGGRGEPMLFLAGSGNTAHVFTHFARRFTDRYHVYAMTRRGFGASSQPSGGYDTRTLANDVVSVLDSLRIAKVHLVGHSLAGDEMTRLAGDHPERVRSLIYLDAAYDRPALGALIAQYPFPDPPTPVEADLASREGFARYVRLVRGVEIPREEIAATFSFDEGGALTGEVTPPSVYAALLGGEESPDYRRVKAPALAIYAVAQDAGDVIPWLTAASPEWELAQQLFGAVFQPFYASQRARFASEVRNATVREVPGASHYVFLSDPTEVARAMRAFLERR
jgi:non-heme chloroperoxidase